MERKMVITLNSEPLEVTIENEKTLDEFISGLSVWLKKSGYEISGIVKDGLNLKLYNNEWNNTNLTTIKKLDITAVSGSEKYISDLQTLYQYISLMHNAVEIGNGPLIKDLKGELPFITNSLDYFFGKKSQKSFESVQLQTLIEESGLSEDNKLGNSDTLKEFLKDMTVILQQRIKEVTTPFSELNSAAQKLKSLVPELSDISVMLQTGKDSTAMNTVLKFIELSEILTRIFPFLKEFGYSDIMNESIDDVSFNDFYRDLNGILMELIEAFDINDSILIGDLVEYEIVPRISILLLYVSQIEKIQE